MWERIGYHLAEADMTDQLRALLLNPAWLAAKLAATDIAALLEDFRSASQYGDVALVGAALRKSAQVIGSDPTQLPGQLVGRLSGLEPPGVQALCRAVDRAATGPWLRPLIPTLTPPGVGDAMALAGHTGWVYAVAVTPDGRHVVSGGDDGTVRVWELATGAETTRFDGHTGRVRAVAVTPDGRHVVIRAATGRCGCGTWRRVPRPPDSTATPAGECGGGDPRRPPRGLRRRRRDGAGVGPGLGRRADPTRRPHRLGQRGGGDPRRPPRGVRQRRRDGAGVGPGHRVPRRPARPATPAGCRRWRSTARRPPGASPAATTRRCGCGTWPSGPETTRFDGHTAAVRAVAVTARRPPASYPAGDADGAGVGPGHRGPETTRLDGHTGR